MKKSSKQSIDVLSALVAEREKYEQWIAALLDKKASTPARVFDRVYADYTARLEAVMEELSARSTELGGQLDSMRAKSQELGEQEEMLREEHAEAELRHAIGEHTPEQWRDIVAASNQAIGKLSAERARIDAELGTLERIMAGIGGDTTAADAAPARTVAPAPVASPPPAPPKAATPAASSATVGRTEAKPPSEEKTRWGGAPPTAKAEPPKATSASRQTPASTPSADLAKSASDAPAPKKPGDPGFDELAFLKSVVPEGPPDATGGRAGRKDRNLTGSQPELAIGDQRAPAQPTGAARSGEGPKVTAEQPPTSSKIETTPATPAAARDANAPLRSSRVMSESDVGAIGVENLSESNQPANETPTFLKNVPSEQSKTLKCGECGALNYATEWYCERCGAELSAL